MQVSLARTAKTPRAAWLRLCGPAAAIGLLMSGGASAQAANDASVRTAHAEWRRLSQDEVNCIDKSLRVQRSGVWLLIQRGINPSDATVAAVRAGCRAQARASHHLTVGQIRPQGAEAMAAADKAPESTVVGNAAADKAATDKAAADKAVADKAAAGKAAADKAAADKIAADRVAADKVAADKIAADKAAADKIAVDKVAADKVAADKVAADKIAADKAAAGKFAADQLAADKAAADKAAADQAAAGKAVPNKTAPDQASTDRTALDMARADAKRATAEAVKAQADAERARKEADKVIAEVGFALAAAESRISFIYGLLWGLALLALSAGALFAIQRKRNAAGTPSEPVAPVSGSRPKQNEFDRLVAAVFNEQKRRDRKAPKPSALPDKPRVEDVELV
jgi:hypothetical protein